MELPGTRRRSQAPHSVLAGMSQSLHLFCESFVQIFNKTHFKTTVTLLVTWTIVLFTYHGLTFYLVEYSKKIQLDEYNNRTVNIFRDSYKDQLFNESIDNQIFTDCLFVNCTFDRIFLSHVHFINCTFTESQFTNIKTSRTFFQHSTLEDVR